MRRTILILLIALSICGSAQKFADLGKGETSVVRFYSKSPIEDIEAINNKVAVIFDINTGDLQSVITMRAFKFKNGLMEEHFNENYAESVKFPNAIFKGRIIEKIDLNSEVAQKVTSNGKLTIHGVTKDVELEGTITKKGENLILVSKLMIVITDYDIKVPALYTKNISESVEVDFNSILTPYVKK